MVSYKALNTFLEGKHPYSSQFVRKRHITKAAAMGESICPDDGHAAWNRDGCEVYAAREDIFW